MALVVRYLLPLLTVAIATEIVHSLSLPRPSPGIISMIVVLLSAWWGGVGPALLLSPYILLTARLHRDAPVRWAAMTPQELLALTVITLLAVSFGLAGQYRRRIQAVTKQHALKLQEQARALSHASILFRELNGRITQWNSGIERLFGWTSAEAIGRLAHELLKSQFPAPLEDIHAQLVRTGQWQGEVVYHHKDGSELHVATHWILSQDAAGDPIGVAEVHNDVTALRRAEAAVREADRCKDEFIAVLAHELRNPLAPIRTGLELMRTVTDDPTLVEETRRVMERQTRQLVTLVDDLLDVSRISRGKLQLRESLVALSEVVASAVEAAKPGIESAGHVLSVTLPEEAVLLHADPHRLAQVLTNLLDNAGKYTPHGGHIWLTAERRTQDLVVTVKDTGMGVPPEMLERIFEMFTRSERTGTMHAGLGIGLALAKSIVEMHGGHIEADSRGAGLGAEFRIVLPLPSEATLTTLIISSPESLSPASESNASKRRVLIVDDNSAAATLLSILVKSIGNDVRIAQDGVECIEVARAFHPEIVLMDLGMPKMDGYEACRYIRQQPWGKRMLLVALTGWSQDGHRQRSKEAGFDHHLVKPADPEELRRLLASANGN